MNSTPFIEGQHKPLISPLRRYWAVYVPLCFLLFVLLGRGFYLQIMHGGLYRTQADENRVTLQTIPAPRGIFYDANNKQLVENISSTDLVLDPLNLPQIEDESYLLENLPSIVPGLTPEDIKDALSKVRSSKRPVLLAKALDHDIVLNIEQAGGSIRGVMLVSSLVRKYLLSENLAHVLGYTSPVTAEELAKHDELLPTDTTGKLGLEQMYDERLRGEHGTAYVEVNASGKPQVNLGKQDPVAGSDLHLTIDADLQEYIYQLFYDLNEKDKEHKTAGAAVVIDPQSGAIKALVSYPSFDPNVFSQPALRKQATQLFSDPLKPLFNRTVDGTYPSGSIIKPFLAAGGLQDGIITANSTVLSTGGITIGPWHFYDWQAGGHGTTDVKKAIAESVNTFFYLLAGGDETHTGLGPEKINHYLREFGWANPTGIDLPTEASGFLPTPAWKEATFHERWYIGDTYHLGIGQGNVLVTPIQVASATAALANGTYWYTPHLLQTDDIQKKTLSVSQKNIQTVREGMREAVTDGSARSLSALSIPLAGKTGTAQIGGSEDTHAWFTSFGPYDKPELVVTVLLEKGGAGDVDAVPLAHDIWQWHIDHPEK